MSDRLKEFNLMTVAKEQITDSGSNIAILAGVVNFLPHPNPPLSKGRE